MKVISYSRKNFESLQPLQLTRNTLNTEARMFLFNFKGKNMVLKNLYHLNGPRFADKLYTIEMLDVYRDFLPENFCIPEYLFTVNGEIQGFTIPYLDGVNLTDILSSKEINFKEQLYYLKKIGETLEQLKNIRESSNLDIFINDLHDSNIMVNQKNKSIKFIDLDSCKIGINKPNPARFLSSASIINNVNNPDKYQYTIDSDNDKLFTANENSDLYSYAIIILNYLYGSNVANIKLDDYYEYLNYLSHIGVNNNLVDIFYKLVSDSDNENPLYYLDTLTNENIFRSKSNVFQKTKNIILK